MLEPAVHAIHLAAAAAAALNKDLHVETWPKVDQVRTSDQNSKCTPMNRKTPVHTEEASCLVPWELNLGKQGMASCLSTLEKLALGNRLEEDGSKDWEPVSGHLS